MYNNPNSFQQNQRRQQVQQQYRKAQNFQRNLYAPHNMTAIGQVNMYGDPSSGPNYMGSPANGYPPGYQPQQNIMMGGNMGQPFSNSYNRPPVASQNDCCEIF